MMKKMGNKGNLIAQLRKEAGFTQKTLAEVLHITDKAVSKWERGVCLPDVSLLPKLSLLLGADMSLMLAPDGKQAHEGRVGLIDARDNGLELFQRIYDKPLVYYILSHFLLLDVREICILCSEKNERYLLRPIFKEFGFSFTFDFSDVSDKKLMIMPKPCFLFGSDLTHQFQGAMVAGSVIKLVPENLESPFLFTPSEYSHFYIDDPGYLDEIAVSRTLGRGMVCLYMDNADNMTEIASFVRAYQRNCQLPIGSLEEIAFRKGIIKRDRLLVMAENLPYGEMLNAIALQDAGKPTVG